MPGASGSGGDMFGRVKYRDSAWGARLRTEEIVARVSHPILQCKKFPLDYQVDFELLSLLAFDQATKGQQFIEHAKRAVKCREEWATNIHSYYLEVYCSLTFAILEHSFDEEYAKQFVEQSRLNRLGVRRAFDGAISHFYVRFRAGHHELHADNEMHPIVIDQMQEYVCRMAKAGWLSAETCFYDEAADQLQIFRSALRSPDTGLWANGRGWFDSEHTLSSAKWGRGHAWLLRGLVETLTYMPTDCQQRTTVLGILLELTETLLRYQDEEGFWHQIVDRRDSYQETSATGMIAYYFARAIRHRLLPEDRYSEAIVRAFEAIMKYKVSADGIVLGGCKSLPPQPSETLYFAWEAPVNDPHGVAGTILAAAAKCLLDGDGTLPPPPRH